MEAWHKLLESTSIKSVISEKRRDLISIPSRGNVSDALRLMELENILSLPVIDHDVNKFIGFIDVLDIAGYVLALWRKISPELDEKRFPADMYMNHSVSEVLNFSHWNYPVFISENASMRELLAMLNEPKYHQRLHRVAVVRDSKVVNVISQSDILGFVYENVKLIPDILANKTLEELKFVRPLIYVRIDSPFVDALEILYKNKISGLALVDNEFHLRGNFSASDLRGMSPTSFHYFNGSVLMFLAKGTHSSGSRPSLDTPPTTTLREAILSLKRNKIHRIYVADQSDRPLGLVTISDVISVLNVLP
jgi:CBS domain-containing protein